MTRPCIVRATLALAVACLAAALAAAPPPGPAPARGSDPAAYVRHAVLPNGLEVFVNQNRAVPLATIMVSFRCGAIAHGPDSAGLFHLYEHMLFAGNGRYRTQSEFMAALNRLGVSEWNGGTSNEYVNYYITVPSDRLDEGLAFWAAAVREPLFDPVQLENEKQVVVNEIRGYHTDFGDIFAGAVAARVFPDFPWRKDISGSERNIMATTPAALRAIQAAWYVPNNAAVLVGGDVDPAAAVKAVERHFGSWARGPQPPSVEPPHPGIPRDLRIVLPDPTFYNGVGLTALSWRGPDVLRQTRDTYVADVLLYLMSSPVGRFKQTLVDTVPGLYDAEHIGFGYPTQRDGGLFEFQALFTYDPAKPARLLERQDALRAAVVAELGRIAANPGAYFGEEELELAKTKLSDQILIGMETPGGVLSNLNFWWATATTDYYYNYEKNCRSVGFDDIRRLLERWIIGQPSITAVRVRADRLAADPASAKPETLGYEVVGPDNAYWWQRPAGAAAPALGGGK